MPIWSKSVPPRNVAQVTDDIAAFSLATQMSLPPALNDWIELPLLPGNEVASVLPPMYTLPELSSVETPIPSPVLPPKKVEYESAVPVELIL